MDNDEAENRLTTELLGNFFKMIDNVPTELAPGLKEEAFKQLRELDNQVARATKADMEIAETLKSVFEEHLGVNQEENDLESEDEDDDNPEETELRNIQKEISDIELMNAIRQKYKELIDGYAEDDIQLTLAREFDALEETAQVERKAAGEDTDDDIVSQVTYVNKDPVTKQKIKRPLKNPWCGHVYDEKSVESLLKNKPDGIQCPIIGCMSKELIKSTSNLAYFPQFFDLCRD